MKHIYLVLIAALFITSIQITHGQVFNLIKDINPGTPGSYPANLTNAGGTLFFSVQESDTSSMKLFKSNGTAAGTILLNDFGKIPTNPPTIPVINSFTNLNGTLFFIRHQKKGFNGSFSELWKSDGTIAGTVEVYSDSPALSNDSKILGTANNFLYFKFNSRFYKSDGTTGGTILVKNFYGAIAYNPGSFININGTPYFSAADSIFGIELWKSDGTTAGTVLVKDIYPGGISSYPAGFTNINGELYFSAADSMHGIELWKSDGTADGTELVKDIYPGSGGNGIPYNNSYPLNLTNVNGTLFFSATDSAHGNELWKSDGTVSGTLLVKDINAGTGDSNPADFLNINGTLYLNASDPINGAELYKSDGTVQGTVLVKDIYTGLTGSSPQNFTNINDELYFSASDSAHGAELWKSDGTSAGTLLVQDFESGTNNGYPENITVINDTVFLTAATPNYGTELYDAVTGTVVPVTLLEFNGILKKDDAVLNWKITTQQNIYQFEVERSTDGHTFKEIGKVSTIKQPGINQYSFTDYNIAVLLSPHVYYRLKQIDKDGTYSYSEIIYLNIANISSYRFSVAPNPVSNSTTISFTLPITVGAEKVSLQIFDIEGRLIKTLVNVQMGAGLHQVIWNVTNDNKSAVTDGIYYLKLNAGNYSETKKLSIIK